MRQNHIEPIAEILTRLIATNSESMATAFKEKIILDSEGNITLSPLHRLMEIAKATTTTIKDIKMLDRIISQLAGSSYGEQLKNSLPYGFRASFIVQNGSGHSSSGGAAGSAAAKDDSKLKFSNSPFIMFSSSVAARTDSTDKINPDPDEPSGPLPNNSRR